MKAQFLIKGNKTKTDFYMFHCDAALMCTDGDEYEQDFFLTI